MYNITPMFLIFPTICLLCSFVRKINRNYIYFLLTTLFILIYSCSLNGADYEGYKILYNYIIEGRNFSEIHGELGYKILMTVFTKLGVGYDLFRLILLSGVTGVLFYSVHKMSPQFALSVYFISTMFVIYTISAYRQYIVMAFSVFWIYRYNLGKKKEAILGTSLLILFHSTALISFTFLMIYSIVKEKTLQQYFKFLKRNGLLLFFCAFLIRIIIFIALRQPFINGFVQRILSVHASASPTLISTGLLARAAFVIILFIMFNIKYINQNLIRMLAIYYFTGMFLYICIPLDFVMGRLMNNVSILSSILIPLIVYNMKINEKETQVDYQRYIQQKKDLFLCLIFLGIIAVVILINQLMRQSGYYPYENIILNMAQG